MARHYSTRDFFRQMPNALLARYFQDQGLFGDLDFAVMKESKPDELFSAWLTLADSQRREMDVEFQEIFKMSCEKGFRAIIDEAGWQLQDDQDGLTFFIEKLSALPNHYDRAMITFLDHNEFWRGATRFYHADSLTFGGSARTCPTNPLRWTRQVFSNLQA